MSQNTDLWFKARRYGWGWTPVRWQGWLTLALYITAAVGGAMVFLDENTPTAGKNVAYAVWLVILTLSLVAISYKKGEKPGWHWGNTDHKKDKS